MGRLVFAVLLAGCYQPGSFPCAGPSCESPADGAPDTGDGAESICVGAAPGMLGEKCFVPRAPFTFAETLNTDDDELCNPAEAAACFITGSQLMIVSRLNVTGGRPLVLWSSDSITIGDNGYLDVASHSGTDKKIGPGSDPDECVAGNGAASEATVPFIGGGGTGGAYRSSGGGGGGAHNTMNTTIAPIAGPPAQGIAFRGGCNGGRGGFSNTNVGFGGGAVYLMAKDEITVGGVIDASGSGGAGGFKQAGMTFGGGNGGGSGGLIGLEAPLIKAINARLVALGGAGGSGAASSNNSNDGQDPQADPPMGAPAAAATTTNNVGGAGCTTSGANGEPGGTVNNSSEGGGGGGGGGCGFIMTLGTLDDTGASIAPPRSFPPM